MEELMEKYFSSGLESREEFEGLFLYQYLVDFTVLGAYWTEEAKNYLDWALAYFRIIKHCKSCQLPALTFSKMEFRHFTISMSFFPPKRWAGEISEWRAAEKCFRANLLYE